MASTETEVQAAAADVEFLIRKSSTTGYQIFSLLTPPIYTAYVLSQRGRNAFTVNRFLRATWTGGAIGTIAGGGFEFIRSNWVENQQKVRSRRIMKAYDTDAIRVDDHATIGAILGGVLCSALLWNRAKVVNVILGGAGLGSSVGLLAHYGRSLSGDRPEKIPIPNIPVESVSTS